MRVLLGFLLLFIMNSALAGWFNGDLGTDVIDRDLYFKDKHDLLGLLDKDECGIICVKFDGLKSAGNEKHGICRIYVEVCKK